MNAETSRPQDDTQARGGDHANAQPRMINFTALPSCLQHLAPDPRWVGWRLEWRVNKTGDGKWTKPPLKVHGGRVGGFAHNDKPATWSVFANAEAALPRGTSGIGLQLGNLAGFAALDLDNVRNPDTGDLLPWARDLITRSRSYAELTPSGEGARILGLIAHDHPYVHTKWSRGDGGEIEIYANISTDGHGRYITVTGAKVLGAPDELADLTTIIDELLVEREAKPGTGSQHGKAKNGFSFDTGEPRGGDKRFELLPRWLRRAITNEAGDRSKLFFGAAAALRRRGWTFNDALALFEANPNGPAAKYANRLKEELARVWGKVEPPAGAQTNDWHITAFDLDAEPDLTDDELAISLGRSGWDLDARYCAPIGGWLLWDKVRWQRAVGMKHMTIVRNFLRSKAVNLMAWATRRTAQILEDDPMAQADADKLMSWAKMQSKGLRTDARFAAVERVARSNAASLATPQQFDADDFLLGTPTGAVNLRTGELLSARREDYITKLTAVGPAPAGTPTPLWDTYLASCFPCNPEIPPFLQRLVGYAITGSAKEHKLVFFWGEGRNGKGTFLNFFEWLFADYAQNIATSVLLESRTQQHSAPLAKLCGARLARGSEISGGSSWDESIIKRLTGGDPITANFMRQDPITFIPKLTLIIDANRRPRIRTVDVAMKERIVLVPWLRKLPEADQDKELLDKLKADGPAILRWAIEGAVEWQRAGLCIPASVKTTTRDYLETEDELGSFLIEETVTDGTADVGSSEIYTRFRQWQDAQGMMRWSQKALITALHERGFTTFRNRGTGLMHVRGLRLFLASYGHGAL